MHLTENHRRRIRGGMEELLEGMGHWLENTLCASWSG
jgi:hypothetical protein